MIFSSSTRRSRASSLWCRHSTCGREILRHDSAIWFQSTGETQGSRSWLQNGTIADKGRGLRGACTRLSEGWRYQFLACPTMFGPHLQISDLTDYGCATPVQRASSGCVHSHMLRQVHSAPINANVVSEDVQHMIVSCKSDATKESSVVTRPTMTQINSTRSK